MQTNPGFLVNFFLNLGFRKRLEVKVTNDLKISTKNGPISIITSQSTDPLFLGESHGILGLGYSSLTSVSEPPYTLFDAWVTNSTYLKNEIGMKGCPYSLIYSSWIDFGNVNGYETHPKCGHILKMTSVSPSKSFYTINVVGISINSKTQILNTRFQKKQWSMADSCTSHLILPAAIVTAFKAELILSGGLTMDGLDETMTKSFAAGEIRIRCSKSDFKWSKLPILSIGIIVNNTTDLMGLNNSTFKYNF
jgi:hypothetical protein